MFSSYWWRVRAEGISFLLSMNVHKFLGQQPMLWEIARTEWRVSETNEKKTFPFVFEWKNKSEDDEREASRTVLQHQENKQRQKSYEKTLNELRRDFLLIFLWKKIFFCYSTGKFWHFMLRRLALWDTKRSHFIMMTWLKKFNTKEFIRELNEIIICTHAYLDKFQRKKINFQYKF